MNAVPVDTRRRAVEAYLRGDGTQAEVAKMFSVLPKTLGAWVRKYRETGDLSPKAYKPGRAYEIDEAGEELLRTWLAEQPDLYEHELVERLAEQGIHVGRSTVGRTLRRLGLSRKKRRS